MTRTGKGQRIILLSQFFDFFSKLDIDDDPEISDGTFNLSTGVAVEQGASDGIPFSI